MFALNQNLANPFRLKSFLKFGYSSKYFLHFKSMFLDNHFPFLYSFCYHKVKLFLFHNPQFNLFLQCKLCYNKFKYCYHFPNHFQLVFYKLRKHIFQFLYQSFCLNQLSYLKALDHTNLLLNIVFLEFLEK